MTAEISLHMRGVPSASSRTMSSRAGSPSVRMIVARSSDSVGGGGVFSRVVTTLEMIACFETSTILEISNEKPYPLTRRRLRARSLRDRPGAVRVRHAIAPVRELPRALGLLARGAHARVRDVRVRGARVADPRRPDLR